MRRPKIDLLNNRSLEEFGIPKPKHRPRETPDVKTHIPNTAYTVEGLGTPGVCRGCHQKIFWIVNDNGKSVPMNSDGTNHFATCPKADQFRR